VTPLVIAPCDTNLSDAAAQTEVCYYS